MPNAKSMLEQILEIAAGLSANESFEGVKNKHLKGIAQQVINLYDIPKEVIFFEVDEVLQAPDNQWHTNAVQCKVYNNIEQWFIKEHGQHEGEERYQKACFEAGYNVFKSSIPPWLTKVLKSNIIPLQVLYLFPVDMTIFRTLFREISIKIFDYHADTSNDHLQDTTFELFKLSKNDVIDRIKQSELKNEKGEVVLLEVQPFPCLSMPIGVVKTWFGSIQYLFDLKIGYHSFIEAYYYPTSGKIGITFFATRQGMQIFTKLLKNIKHYPKLKRNRKMVEEKREVMQNMQKIAADWINKHRLRLLERDEVTGLHIGKVTLYTMLALMSLGCNTKTLRIGVLGSLIHDIGKDAIPDEVLQKTGAFTILDRAIMDDHSLLGAALAIDASVGFQTEANNASQTQSQSSLAQLLSGDSTNFSDLMSNIIEIIRLTIEHHEDAQGSGLPFGAQPSDISLIGFVMQVADIFEAMSATRQYKKGMSFDETIAFLTNVLPSGTFEPKILRVFSEKVLPFIKKNFDTNTDRFLSEEIEEDAELKEVLLGILQGNITTADHELTKDLSASQSLQLWAKHRYHAPRENRVIQNMTVGSFHGYYEKLEVIAFFATMIKNAQKSLAEKNEKFNPFDNNLFAKEIELIHPTITSNVLKIMQRISNRQRLMPFWENSLHYDDWQWINDQIRDEKPIDDEFKQLINVTQDRYQEKLPYLQQAMRQPLMPAAAY